VAGAVWAAVSGGASLPAGATVRAQVDYLTLEATAGGYEVGGWC